MPICTAYLAKSNFFTDNKEPQIKLPKPWLTMLRWAFSKSYHEFIRQGMRLNINELKDFNKVLHNSFKYLK